ncbi:MAG TPA: tripartite tricarboxylate transporter permease, partial [Afifellaceae bacterium]|nr:tripartite tricarboxylate transporter permease [Afifellaceae bacterium]
MTAFFEAITFVLNPFDWPLYLMIFGTVVSIFIGAVPGLTGGMLISLCIPLTFGMNATNALVMLVSMYVGSVSGGLVSATLLRMPGTPSSVMTTLDGFPMAQKGQPERAL